MRTKLFSSAVLVVLGLSATCFADWNATDKALGHEGKTFYGRDYYSRNVQQPTYGAAPVMSYRAAPVMAYRAAAPAPVVMAAPAAAPQVATTNTNTERRSFSVEPTAPVVNNNPVYMMPRSYNNNARVNHQPNYTQADTKIRGREGN